MSKHFHLPDLGEGLPDAEIVEWHVEVGDNIDADAPLVSMETAKAVVEVPSPQSGVIKTLRGNPGDVIKTGAVLVEFEGSEDTGTVVGNISESQTIETDDTFSSKQASCAIATPQVRALARKLGVNLQTLTPDNTDNIITAEMVQASADTATKASGFEPLRGTRRMMAQTMANSHAQVVPVALFDDADISHWDKDTDISVRLIQAMLHAIKIEPALNASFNTDLVARKIHPHVNIGLAMDSEEGLFVPVIKNAQDLSATALREAINQFKTRVSERTIAPEDLTEATITLSNFGKFAGRYATPIIVPPQVAILAVGKLSNNTLPLSLSFDHRATTGGEAARFLGEIILALGQ